MIRALRTRKGNVEAHVAENVNKTGQITQVKPSKKRGNNVHWFSFNTKHIYIYPCLYTSIFIYRYIYMYIYIYTYVCAYIEIGLDGLFLSRFPSVSLKFYICMHTCTYAYICIFIYICSCVYIHIY